MVLRMARDRARTTRHSRTHRRARHHDIYACCNPRRREIFPRFRAMPPRSATIRLRSDERAERRGTKARLTQLASELIFAIDDTAVLDDGVADDPRHAEWTHFRFKGETWNPVIARDKQTGKRGWRANARRAASIAMRSARTRCARRHHAPTGATGLISTDETLTAPLGKRRAVCSMSDLFGDFVSDAMIDRVSPSPHSARSTSLSC